MEPAQARDARQQAGDALPTADAWAGPARASARAAVPGCPELPCRLPRGKDGAGAASPSTFLPGSPGAGCARPALGKLRGSKNDSFSSTLETGNTEAKPRGGFVLVGLIHPKDTLPAETRSETVGGGVTGRAA